VLWFGEPPSASEWPGPDSVIVVPMMNQSLLLVRNLRRSGWEFPGGRMLAGESPEQAARREVAEEAGACLGELHPLCWYTVRNTPPQSLSRGIVYVADLASFGSPADKDEVADVRLFSSPPAELSFKDGFTELAFELLFGTAEKRQASR
jgi:8-oxo-dGTP diphosphatase